MTIYKQIPGYEGLYEAGDDGTVWGCNRKITFSKLSSDSIQKQNLKRRKLKPSSKKRLQSTHYDYRVELCKNGTYKTFLVARLVAMAFVSNPYCKPCVNHIDGNTFNNRQDNLEWCTYAENIEHAYRTGLRKNNKHVKLVSSKNGFTNEFYSMAQASEWLGFNRSYISRLLSEGGTSVGEYQIIR